MEKSYNKKKGAFAISVLLSAIPLIGFNKSFAASLTDRELVAATIVLEAGGEGCTGMKAVANVIANRAARKGVRPVRVVTRPWQFSALNSKRYEFLVEKAKASPSWKFACELAALIETGELDDITGGADHYHAANITPKWALAMAQTATYGRHKFYSSKKAAEITANES